MQNYECDCICHGSSDVRHCMPCCMRCDTCNHNIVLGYMDEHVRQCHATPLLPTPDKVDNLKQEIRDYLRFHMDAFVPVSETVDKVFEEIKRRGFVIVQENVSRVM